MDQCRLGDTRAILQGRNERGQCFGAEEILKATPLHESGPKWSPIFCLLKSTHCHKRECQPVSAGQTRFRQWQNIWSNTIEQQDLLEIQENALCTANHTSCIVPLSLYASLLNLLFSSSAQVHA